MDEDKNYLLREGRISSEEGGLFRGQQKRTFIRRFANWNVALLVANIVLLVAGLATWSRVNTQLKGFQCGPKKNKFEPDRE